MPQSDILKRYLDAGLAFTQMTRERAEAIVQELVKAGEVRRKEAEKNIEVLVERSRRNTEELVGIIRSEIAQQLKALGLGGSGGRASATSTEGPTTTPSTKKAASKKAAAPKKAATTAKKAATKKATATKKAAPKKAR